MSYKLAVFVLAVVVLFTWIVPMVNPTMRGVYVYENVINTINGISRPAVDLIEEGVDFLMKDNTPNIETVFYASVPMMYRGTFWPFKPNMTILGRADLIGGIQAPYYAVKVSGNSYFTYLVGSLLFGLTDIDPEDYVCYIAVGDVLLGTAFGIMLYNNQGYNRSLRMADRYAIQAHSYQDGIIDGYIYNDEYYFPNGDWHIEGIDGDFNATDVDFQFRLYLASTNGDKMTLNYRDALKWFG